MPLRFSSRPTKINYTETSPSISRKPIRCALNFNQSIKSIRDLYNGAIIRRARRRVRGAGMSHVIS